jgi:hypothetical protein
MVPIWRRHAARDPPMRAWRIPFAEHLGSHTELADLCVLPLFSLAMRHLRTRDHFLMLGYAI